MKRGMIMSSISNIGHFVLPNDALANLTAIYRRIGQNEAMYQVLKADIDRVVEQTVQRDGYFLARILDLKITDTRMRLILTKDSNPRNKEEKTLSQIKEVLRKIQKHYPKMRHQSNDLLDFANFIYGHYGEVKFAYAEADRRAVLQSQAKKSKRLIIDEINEKVENYLEKREYERLIVYSHYYIDFFNIAPFTSHNHATGLLLLYLLILKGEIEAFRYISFFEILYGEYPAFIKELQNASVNWREGLSQTLGFVRFIFRFILQGYEKADAVINEYKFDATLNKSDNIENTIYRLPKIFTKEEIRIQHPYVSESTINRTLLKMREAGCIRPLGKGRSAKWIRIEND